MKTYKDNFTVSDEVGDLYVCSTWVGNGETTINKVFLEAYFINLGDSFECEVDTGGCILLETINVFDDGDYRGT